MSGRFFTQINYSASNEDSNSELAALNLSHDDCVVCITGSGARSLDLLAGDPQTIFSVDFNPAQNHLLQLKIAAYRTLGYDEFAQFIGLRNDNSSAARSNGLFETVLKAIPCESRDFWVENQKIAKRGVLYCGTWERLLRMFSKATVLRRRHVNGLLHAADLDSQIAYWRKHWSGSFFKNFLRVTFNRFLWTSVIREPGAKLIPRDFDVAEYLYRCIEKMANQSLLRENSYANLLFCGEYTNDCELPFHLQRKNFETIKSRVDKINIVTTPLNEFLRCHPDEFDAFSLSDFSSYAPSSLYQSIWNSVVGSAKDNARYCERFFMVKMDEILKKQTDQNRNESEARDWESHLNPNYELKDALESSDHTCLYSFRVGTIAKN
ncbi:MAG: DUF3419 family protein [Mariniblastus sp.]